MAAPEERELTAEQTEKLLQFQVRRAGHPAAVPPPPGPIGPQPGRGQRAGPARSGCGGAGPGPSRGRSVLAALRRPPGPGGAVPGAAGPSELAEGPALGSVPVIRGGCSVTPCRLRGPPRPFWGGRLGPGRAAARRWLRALPGVCGVRRGSPGACGFPGIGAAPLGAVVPAGGGPRGWKAPVSAQRGLSPVAFGLPGSRGCAVLESVKRN